ncbi:hypothetical protein F5972_19570 [Microbispora cellulosiformans]|uniref:Uncharacterized protein n=1 Tax=Microbispora cellulosiformans TaxID=2614688 RepID=A0A5J5K0P1_9ACTN|nr:hypothetical protein [Microbispora cellulosiformans]KAA9377786.1 hypothetical protein F5972_19570 [Microbispora cellulosiformans]
MKAFLVFLCVAAVGAFAAVLLLLRSSEDSGREPVASGSSVTAAASPVTPKSVPTPKSVLLDAEGAVIEEFAGDCVGSAHPYLCRYVSERLLAEDPRLLTRDGLTIRTTIDQRLQRAAQQAVDAYVDRDDPQLATQVLIRRKTAPGDRAVHAGYHRGRSRLGGQLLRKPRRSWPLLRADGDHGDP